MHRRAFICGLSGPSLTPNERDFLGSQRPAGIILFARNVTSPDQVRQLLTEASDAAAADGDFLIMVDQEGGRVQRLTAPHWPHYPAARAFGEVYKKDPERAKRAAYLCGRLMAQDLYALGFNTSCAPVLDVPAPGADNVIGDRAHGDDPGVITELGGAVADGLLAGGILPVMKHIPGHGRAMADSHFALPVVNAPLSALEAIDFAPFKALSHLPIAMTAHVVFTAIDPDAPATVSRRTIDEAIRGHMGFNGLLMSDDLCMRALSGSLEDRTRESLEAGCDLGLHCNGRLDEMTIVASSSPELKGKALSRFQGALAQCKKPEDFDCQEAELARAETLAAFA